MYESGTGSSHTVCQIPLEGVYQIPSGRRTCLPRGWVPASLGSTTRTTTSCGPKGRSASVTSKVKGSKPPRWPPTGRPFTSTVASQSTAPKWSSTRRPDQAPGSSNVRRYHKARPSTDSPIPDSDDSTGNGTSTERSRTGGGPASAERTRSATGR